MTSRDIEIKSATQSIEVNKLQLQILSHTLFENVIISATLKPVVHTVTPLQYVITISGDAYNQWGQDDTYIVNYVLNYLSIQLS